MTRRILALMLITLTTGSCFGQNQSSSSSPEEQVRAIAANSPVEVKFVDGSKQRGRISEVSDSGFVLNREKDNQIEKAQVTYVEVKTVKQVKDVKTHKNRNVLIGVAIVVGIGVVAVVVFAVGIAKLQGRIT